MDGLALINYWRKSEWTGQEELRDPGIRLQLATYATQASYPLIQR